MTGHTGKSQAQSLRGSYPLQGCLTRAQQHQLRLLNQAAHSATINRGKRVLSTYVHDKDRHRNLLSVLIVEVAARPRFARLIEWALYGLVPQAWAKFMTVGPFQIRGGPFAFDTAAQEAVRILSSVQTNGTWEQARLWNGPNANQRPRKDLWSYKECLELANALLIAPPPSGVCGKCQSRECYVSSTLLGE